MNKEIYSLLGELSKEEKDSEKMGRLADYLCDTDDNEIKEIFREHLSESPEDRTLIDDFEDDGPISLQMDSHSQSQLKSQLKSLG